MPVSLLIKFSQNSGFCLFVHLSVSLALNYMAAQVGSEFLPDDLTDIFHSLRNVCHLSITIDLLFS